MLAFFLAGTEALGLQAGTETLEVQGGCGESKDPWPECAKPSKKFEHIMNTQPDKQWPEAGGYCGAWSTQRAAMESELAPAWEVVHSPGVFIRSDIHASLPCIAPRTCFVENRGLISVSLPRFPTRRNTYVSQTSKLSKS